MAKLKTNKAIAKRFRLTRRGKVMYRKGGKGHLLSSKARKRKRSLNKIESLKNSPLAKKFAVHL